MELNDMHRRDEERARKVSGEVRVFKFGGDYSGSKYGAGIGWIKREIVIRDIQKLLNTKNVVITVYRPKDETHRKSLYFKPMNLWNKGDTTEKLNLEKIGEATYQDGQIESVITF